MRVTKVSKATVRPDYHFIHIPKNGGMAIRKRPEIRTFVDCSHQGCWIPERYQEYVAIMAQNGEHVGPEHARWRDLLPYTHDRKFFAFVRNPWSRVVSRYTFMMNSIKHGTKYAHLYYKMSFEEFVDQRHKWKDKPYYYARAINNWYNQIDHVTDEDGNLRVDVLRFEHHSDDFKKYYGKRTNYHNVSNGNMAGDRNSISNRRDYKEFYTPQLIQIIADWYQPDIEFFGFDFDSAATKNICLK